MASRWRGVTLVVAAIGATAGACDLIVSTDGLAGPPAETDASDDVAPEAALEDAGDAAPEADADADSATAPPFCGSIVPAPIYCADFDEGKPVGDYGTVSASTTPPRIDLAHGRSGAASLLFDVPGTDAGQSQGSALTADLGGRAFAIFAMDLSLRLDAATSSGGTQLAALRIGDGSQNFILLVTMDGGRIQIIESNGPGGTEHSAVFLDVPLQSTEWIDLRLEGSLSGTSPSVRLFVNDVKAAEAVPPTLTSGAEVAQNVVYGVYYSGQNQPEKTFDIDNVVVDLH